MAPCAMDSLAMEGAVHSHSDFRVRRSVVHRALNWLVTHNQYCRCNHVHIDVNPLQQLPHDGNLSTSLPSLLRTPSLNLLPPTPATGPPLADTHGTSEDPYSAHLPQSFVPIATRSMTEQEAVHQSVQERQLSPSISSSPATMMWPLLEEYPSMSSPPRATHLQQLATNRQRRLESEMAEESYTRLFFSAISIFLPYIRSCNVCQPCAMDLSATDSSAMAWRSTQQRRIAAESTEETEARLHQLSVTQRQRIAAESTEEREARLQQLRILPNRNNHQDLLINCHSKYIPILLVLIDVFHYAIIEAFVMLFH